ncbi:MAG: hypothetical protein AAGJ82_12135, partial [Bacteroidota bacterium]
MDAYEQLEELLLHYDFEELRSEDQLRVLAEMTAEEYEQLRLILTASRQTLAQTPPPPSDLQTGLRRVVATKRTLIIRRIWAAAATAAACLLAFGLGWWWAPREPNLFVENTLPSPQLIIKYDTVYLPQRVTEWQTRYVTSVQYDTVYLPSDTVFFEH